MSRLIGWCQVWRQGGAERGTNGEGQQAERGGEGGGFLGLVAFGLLTSGLWAPALAVAGVAAAAHGRALRGDVAGDPPAVSPAARGVQANAVRGPSGASRRPAPGTPRSPPSPAP